MLVHSSAVNKGLPQSIAS